MKKFSIPSRSEVSENNQEIFDNLEKTLGFVPNLYAYYAKNDTALKDYLALQQRKSTLKAKEREVINLVVSEFNNCSYCLSAHTVIGKMNGFSEEQILQIRSGKINFDDKVNALIRFTRSMLENKGNVPEETVDSFFDAGYSESNMIDVIIVIGDKMISNYINNLTNLEIDFPVAAALSEEVA